MSKIAVFGSAFNPPSLGHKSVIESLAHFDRVLLLPSISHAWGKDMLKYDIRCQLVDAFIQDLSVENAQRSTIEEELFQPGCAVTTFAVLDALQKKHPDSELTFVLGPDNLFNFSKFYKAEEILQRWSLLACPERVKVRSTDIREKLTHGSSIEGLTTQKVAFLLKELSVY
ncbi:nicotinate-nicotinamide nucleotide adenylyltransferase [Vibrio sp. YMD68]|uniref:nicotinate-nicotinamide nucleotide adenylyltransferase n=1 Tax=Vibrio sp. YMD68 TaxID=3042300 RepID=UPI002499C15C|nr:nicotinate-nicotinamide nucleotide adenylyltransferase [Vibrio sp. YMD68]WGV98424.1 nicotinate-nicotinamide nucleotide adenylyltransferase [Vibrio sp. YMD68]